MRNIIKILFLIILTSKTLIAQDYYWNGDKKVILKKDYSSIVIFEKEDKIPLNINHLNIKDRENIYRLKNKNFSINEIASDLSRSKSTIYRELKRNKDIVLGYLPDRADLLAKKRKFVYKDKIINNPYLIKHIIEKLNEGLSP